jgi:hypothetical protein
MTSRTRKVTVNITSRVKGKPNPILSEIKRTEDERERLSKLLIEARMEIVRLRKGIEKHRQLVGTHNSLVDDELYKLLVGEGK